MSYYDLTTLDSDSHTENYLKDFQENFQDLVRNTEDYLPEITSRYRYYELYNLLTDLLFTLSKEFTFLKDSYELRNSGSNAPKNRLKDESRRLWNSNRMNASSTYHKQHREYLALWIAIHICDSTKLDSIISSLHEIDENLALEYFYKLNQICKNPYVDIPAHYITSLPQSTVNVPVIPIPEVIKAPDYPKTNLQLFISNNKVMYDKSMKVLRKLEECYDTKKCPDLTQVKFYVVKAKQALYHLNDTSVDQKTLVNEAFDLEILMNCLIPIEKTFATLYICNGNSKNGKLLGDVELPPFYKNYEVEKSLFGTFVEGLALNFDFKFEKSYSMQAMKAKDVFKEVIIFVNALLIFISREYDGNSFPVNVNIETVSKSERPFFDSLISQ